MPQDSAHSMKHHASPGNSISSVPKHEEVWRASHRHLEIVHQNLNEKPTYSVQTTCFSTFEKTCLYPKEKQASQTQPTIFSLLDKWEQRGRSENTYQAHRNLASKSGKKKKLKASQKMAKACKQPTKQTESYKKNDHQCACISLSYQGAGNLLHLCARGPLSHNPSMTDLLKLLFKGISSEGLWPITFSYLLALHYFCIAIGHHHCTLLFSTVQKKKLCTVPISIHHQKPK